MSTAETNTTDTTSVEQVEINLDEILGTPGAENVMLPEGSDKKVEAKPSIFAKPEIDLSFIDNDSDDESTEKVTIDEIIKDADPNDDFSDPSTKDEVKSSGRPKLEKSGMVELVNKLIEKGQIIPFDDDKPIEEYSVKDFEELLEANMQEKEQKIRQETPVEFFESLPQELQYAAKYVADGGQDLKGLFRALAQVEEVRNLDVSEPSGQAQIVREYLRATNWGTDEDIEEEIEDLKDRGKLDAKAESYKPKLDRMQEAMVARKVAQQEELKKQQRAAAEHYMQNIYDTLSPGELNGVKLDKRTQGLLYAGLVQANFPSMSGNPTNMLGHLLEKYQYVEPRHDLIAEALWLLADPDTYKAKIREIGKAAAVEKTVRQLKTEQAKLQSAAPVIEKEETSQRRISRGNNFWKR